MTRLADLLDQASAAELESAWQELRRRRAIRDADPLLRDAIIRICNGLPSEVAATILVDLDEMVPAVVLDAHFRTLVKDRPTVGAVIRRRETAT